MYKFDDSIPSTPSKDYMEPGIHENVELISYDYRTSKNDNKFIELVFGNKFSEKLAHTEWEPSDPDPDKLKDKILNQITRFKYILASLLPGESINFEFNDFDDFAKKLMILLKEKYKNQKVRIKVIYNRKNYTTLPNYLKIPWVESMVIPKEESRLSIIERIDKIKKDSPTSIETNENPFAPKADNTNTESPF